MKKIIIARPANGLLRKIVILFAGLTSAPLQAQQDEALKPLATGTAIMKAVDQYHMLDGKIESLNNSTLSAQTNGIISLLKYDVGDVVEKGAVVARITAKNQRAGVLEAQASVSQTSATVAQAQASLRSSKASYAVAKAEFDRVNRIYKQRLISKSMYDKAEAEVKSAAAQVDASKANLNAASATNRAAKAGLTKAGEQLGYTEIRAPYSGIVTERHVELGELVSTGKPIMSGISLKGMRASTTIPQRLISKVREHKKARVFVADDATGIEANSLTIFPYADPNTNGFKVRVGINEGVKGLFPGVFVKVGFSTGQSDKIVVPISAIAYRGEVTAAYVVSEDGMPHFRQVRLGRQVDDKHIAITAGIHVNETIALDPVHAAITLKQLRSQAEGGEDE